MNCIYVVLVAFVVGFMVAAFFNIQLDDRNYIDFGSAQKLDSKLNNYCNSNYKNMFGVERWHYDAFGKFSAFQCKYNSPIESVSKLKEKE